MYLPRAFTLENAEAVARLLREHTFALLITGGEGKGIEASHLPLRVTFDQALSPSRVFGHLAASNPQARTLRDAAEAGEEALAIFSGPHAYVSPAHYAPGPAVPTWNYLAVHIRGRLRLVEDAETVMAELRQLVADYEGHKSRPWNLDAQDPAFLQRQLGGIRAFELTDLSVSAKAKLSQNRSAADQQAVTAAMQEEAPELAAWMEELLLSRQP